MSAAESLALTKLRVRGRNFMALVLAPEPPLGAWFRALDQQLGEAGGFIGGRPVVLDLTATRLDGREAAEILLEGLEARNLRIIGVEGVDHAWLAGTRWSMLAADLPGREVARELVPTAAAETRRDAAGGLLIDGPVRSGQSVVFEDGDLTVVGAVASGAEVIAGGSIHVYGALRGRAIAGVKAGAEAASGASRIFCRRLEAEMVGIERLYRTAEHWGAGLHGKPAQIRCDRGALRIMPLD